LLEFRPGLTSPASIAFRHEAELLSEVPTTPEIAYTSVVLPAKLRLDLEYFSRATARSDLMVLIKTVRAVVDRHPSELSRALVRELTQSIPDEVLEPDAGTTSA
jgi:lipopolysaccharide/colanic/teichoic acid biosynthesis glycosyltransferase